jgi:glycosyltransferase involved in cell wall biosynthesis
LYSFEAKRNLEKLILEAKPDVAHIHLYKGGLTASILPVLKKYKIPVVITLHDYSLLCPRNIMIDGDGKICEKCLTSSTINCLLKRCNRKNIFYSTISYIEFNLNNNLLKPEDYFSKIICVSKFNYEKHLVKTNLKEKLEHVYNFNSRLNNSIPNQTKGGYFLFYGRLSLEKGLLTLVNAWKQVNNKIRLKIVGEGALSQQIEQNIRENKIENIEILGYKTGEVLNQLIRDASFIIVPSEWYENNPMTIIEGYSMGKPVIGSNIGGIPELIQDGKTGFLFEMENVDDLVLKINRADSLSDENYEMFSKAAVQFANENFSEDLHYNKLMKIFTDVINTNS